MDRRVVGLGAAVVFVVALLVLVTINAPADGPDHPYDHENFSEVSVATEKVVAGPVRTVVEGLEARGYWCVQPRWNNFAVQVTCQGEAQVDLIVTGQGAISYAAISDFNGRQESRKRFWRVLNASLLRLWPNERTVIEDLLAESQPHTFLGNDPVAPSDPRDQYATYEVQTDTASWSLRSRYTGEPLTLRLRTAHLRDHSWPFGSRHYAKSFSVATTALRSAGFTCATACYRAADNQTVNFDTHDGQIVTAEFTLRTRADGTPADDPAGRWVRAGLPFLTSDVRAAVGRRIELSRVERQSWRGVVAGTPVNITAVTGASSTLDGHGAYDIRVAIGIALPYVE